MEAYKSLTTIFTRLHRFEHCSAMLQWDANVNMPPKSEEARGAALAELAKVQHEIICAPELGDLIAAAKTGAACLSAVERANVREIERLWCHAKRLPEVLIEKIALATSRSQAAWQACRASNDWARFVPFLTENVVLNREKASLLAADGGAAHPYEALMRIHEPGASLERTKALFDDIKQWLPGLIKQVMTKQRALGPITSPVGPFDRALQERLNRKMMELWSFDFDAGRLDVSAHPFCGGAPEDVRITTRFSDDNFSDSLLAVIHETGHAKYEQNRPREVLTQPVSAARSMGIHESQSLFSEMQIGHSPAFIQFLQPLLLSTFASDGDEKNAAAFDPTNLTRFVNQVAPGSIRVDADELTYPLHVILRFDIELALFDGSLEVEGIPARWDALMLEYLGLDTRGNHKDGALQDIHWSFGAFGYFPTYTIGAACAAQFMAAAKRDLGGESAFDALVRAGNLDPIIEWQRAKVWCKGSILETDDLVAAATGTPLDVAHYKAHLHRRYLD